MLTRISRHLIAGETLSEAVPVLRRLRAQGFWTLLRWLGPVTPFDFSRSVALLKKNGLDRQFLLPLSARVFVPHSESFIWLEPDAKNFHSESLAMVLNRFEASPAVGMVLESSKRQAAETLLKLMEHRVRVCLTGDSLSLAQRLLTSQGYHAVVSGDPVFVRRLIRFAASKAIDPESFEIQLAYGLHPRLAKEVRDQGWKVRLIVPCGPVWLPYASRLPAEFFGSLVGRLHRRVQNFFESV